MCGVASIANASSEHEEMDAELAWLASFPERSPIPIVEVDLSGQIRYINPAAITLFPDLQQTGLDHPWLVDWHVVEQTLRVGSAKTHVRAVPVDAGVYHQVAVYLPETQRIRVYGIDVTEQKQAEERLRESEARSRALFSSMAEGYALHELLFDAEGHPCDYRFLTVNPAFEKLTGLCAQDIVGRTVREVIPGIDPIWIERYGRVTLTSQSERFEAFSKPRDCWYEIHASAIGPSQFSTILLDITDRKRAESALKQQQEELAKAQHLAHVGTWHWDASTDAVTGSEELLRIYGFDPDVESMPSLQHQKGRCYGDAEWERLHTAVQATLQTGTAFKTEVQAIRGDSAIWIVVHGEVVRDTQGRAVGLRGTVQDVTERKLHECRLAQISRLYAVLSRVNEAIVRTRKPSILYAEVCHILAEDGERPLAWIGLVDGREVRPAAANGEAADYVRSLHVEVDGEWGTGPVGTCVREGRTVVADDFDTNLHTLPWRESALRHGLRAAAAFPLRHQGSVIGALALYDRQPGTFDSEQIQLLEALCADVSFALDTMTQEKALRDSERSLREADRRKTEFLAMLSHELRNPLTPIRNSLFILEHVPEGSDKAQRAKCILDRQVHQLTRLVDDLLDVTRITRGKIQVQREPLNLVDLVRRTLEDHRPELVRAGVELEVRLEDGPLEVNADAARLAQAIGNLMQNAAKFTPKGGRVTVTLEDDAVRSVAVLRVRDTGVGISPEVLPHLFEPFTQAESTLDRSRGGLGLGLALVKGLTELHGGSVAAQSAGLGKGAEFVLVLPRQPPRVLSVVEVSSTLTCPPRRLLVIEDNVDAACSLRTALELSGHTVAVAYNGPDGLREARSLHPEAVLCDIGLPGMDGYEVAKAFRADPALASVLLVAVTGYTLAEDVAKAHEAGFDKHLGKPPSMEQLQQILAFDVPGPTTCE